LMAKSVCLRPWSLGDQSLQKLIRGRIALRLLLGDALFQRLSKTASLIS